MTTETFNLTNKTKTRTPIVRFEEIKNTVLGKKYQLSLVFVGDQKSKYLNNTYRGKNKPTNCLSFPLEKSSGEIFINLSKAKKESPKFQKSYVKFVTHLFIHSMLHLKGMEHGSRMERAEAKLLKQFKCEN